MSFFHSYRLSLLINGIIIENRRKNMSFVSYLINGLSLGSVYALIALGYTMVYGILYFRVLDAALVQQCMAVCKLQ